jgi:hypothetical protein
MLAHDDNPRLSPLVRIFALIVLAVLLIGSLLFLLPDPLLPRWPWQLTPFNTRFLGSVYMAEFVGLGALALWTRWAPARVVLLMALVFTAEVSAVTLVYFDRFDPARRATWIWFTVYIGSAAVSAYFLWLYHKLAPGNRISLSAPWRSFLLAEALVLGLYAVGLLVLPETFSAFWPWRLDDFHARIYSGIFFTGAAGAAALSAAASPIEMRVYGASQAAFSLCAVLGLVIVDTSVHRVDWSSAGTWLWIGGFTAIFLAGAAVAWQSRWGEPRVEARAGAVRHDDAAQISGS